MTIAPPPVYKSRFLKADRRTVLKAAGSQTYRTSVEHLVRLDDVFIRPGASVQVEAAGLGGQLLVLPIVGGALLATRQETESVLRPGYIYAVPVADAPLTLTNPFEKETVNLLLIAASVPLAAARAVQELELPLTAKNALVGPADHPLPVRVGLYDSRVKGRIPVLDPTGYSLCYVLNGSFEIEDRLAEHRDALLLWETPGIDFEALAETAMLLYLEFSL
ncbi:hypothetical protein [Hymenobacter convexus]|uniref:hypothetical protein n=1 Tax=Hymenobacter sp. CA1UV-4 TaxID=3063782 RepID=UPI002713245D|nr:hypothetical protein [Hymenobacter sp. CA1UV-4]MDO7850638.1 hypothetical protein [Hymenobacter sp. CA1UV-4]